MKHSFIDKYSNLKSPIHRIDPRVKIITFITFVLFVITTPPASFLSFSLYGAVLIVLIMLSKIPPSFIFKRSLIIIPFVLMVAIFIPFFKKGEVAGGYSFGTFKLTLTYDGLLIFWNVLIKSYLSCLCMLLISTTTKFSSLLQALEKMRFPKLIIMILSFMYRYIYVLADELMRMERAKASRTARRNKWQNTKASAHMIGSLFVRAYERGERVYLAMCSRGFTGEIKILEDFETNKRDFYFLVSIATLLIVIKFW